MQAELLKGESAVETSDCKKLLDLFLGAGTGSRHACKMCAQVEDLLKQVVKLQEVVRRRLHNIRKPEKELNGSKCSLLWTHSPWLNSQKHPHCHIQKGERGQ